MLKQTKIACNQCLSIFNQFTAAQNQLTVYRFFPLKTPEIALKSTKI